MDRSRKKFDLDERIDRKSTAGLPLTINDLKEKEFSGEPLAEDEKEALLNFDNYRIEYLNAARDEDEFHERYMKMQARANLSSYQDFIFGDDEDEEF